MDFRVSVRHLDPLILLPTTPQKWNAKGFLPDLPSSLLERLSAILGRPTGREQLIGTTEALAAPYTISPDGRYLASGYGDPTLQVWDLKTGSQVRRLPTGWVDSVVFDPTGKTVLVAEHTEGKRSTVSRWDLETSRRLWVAPGCYEEVRTVRFAPDGRSALVIGRFNGVSLWDVENGKPIGRLGPAGREAPSAATFLGAGQQIATATDEGLIQVWQLTNGLRPDCGNCATSQVNYRSKSLQFGRIILRPRVRIMRDVQNLKR